MEIIIFNPFINDKPFCIKQSNGDTKIYTRDEIKAKGDAYDIAASKAITTLRPVEIK